MTVCKMEKSNFLVLLLASSASGFSPSISSVSHPRRRRLPGVPVPVLPRDATGSTSTSTTSSSALHLMEGNAVLATLDTFYQSQPYVSAFLTCSIKASAADLVAQQQPEDDAQQPDDVDVKRNLAFLLYGGLYQGCAQQWLFSDLYPSLFGDSTSLLTVLEQVALDMAVLSPFLCLPLAYLVKSCIAQNGLVQGVERYVAHVRQEGLLFKYWSIWVPVNCLTFSVVPVHLRIPWIAFVSFFWLMILSSISSRQQQQQHDATTTATAAPVRVTLSE